jgi:cellulose biosynthesis protein BcsQ
MNFGNSGFGISDSVWISIAKREGRNAHFTDLVTPCVNSRTHHVTHAYDVLKSYVDRPSIPRCHRTRKDFRNANLVFHRSSRSKERDLIISIASLKGGVGKSTITAMLARQIVDQRRASVLVIDMDPQRGATILLLGPEMGTKIEPPTIYDILLNRLERNPPTPVFMQAIRASPYREDIYVLPATGELGNLTRTDAPANLLKTALAGYPLSKDLIVIVDTGSNHVLCEMSIAASNLAFIPVTLSHQSGVPTVNTLKTCMIHETPVGGLIPIMVGKAGWQKGTMEAWRARLQTAETLKEMGTEVLSPMPFSQAIVRGKWRWGKIPQRFHPTLDEMISMIFKHPAWTRRDTYDEEPWNSMFVDKGERITA